MKQGLLDGKIAVITGASSGIGKAIAFRYALEGAKIVISSRNIENCEVIANEIRSNNHEAIAISCDIRKEDEVKNLFDKTIQVYGKVDIVVASAGISGGNKMIEDYSLDQWNSVMSTNLTGSFLTAKEAFKCMKQHGGHILILSSQAGIEGYSGKGAYCASKFGVRGLAHTDANECILL